MLGIIKNKNSVLVFLCISFICINVQAQDFNPLLNSVIKAGVRNLQESQVKQKDTVPSGVQQSVVEGKEVVVLPVTNSLNKARKPMENHLSCLKFISNDAQKSILLSNNVISKKGTPGVQGSEVFVPIAPFQVFGMSVRSFNFFGQETEQLSWVVLDVNVKTAVDTLQKTGLKLKKNGKSGYTSASTNNLQVSVANSGGETILSCEVTDIN